MDQLPLKQGSWAIYVPKNGIFFCNLLRWFLPIFFLNIKLLFWDIIRWRNSRGCAIYVGIPSLILAKWRKLFWASKGRDALKPNFNKWPEEPFLPSRNGSSGHLVKFGLLAKWRHRCPKKDNSDVFPGGFASCLGITLIDVAYFGLVGWWMSGDMRELRHLCPKKAAWCWEKKWGETSAVPIFHLGSPRKTDPTKCQVSFGNLRKNLFFGGLGGVGFPGLSKVANCQSAEDCKKIGHDIDGATPTHLPKSGCKCPHRWRNSLISPDTHQPTKPKYARSMPHLLSWSRNMPPKSGLFSNNSKPHRRGFLHIRVANMNQVANQRILGDFGGYVGPLGALLAAFGPKISTPTEAWFGWGWILCQFRAYVGQFRGYVKPLLGHVKALLATSGLKFQPQPKHGSVEVEFWVGFGLMLGHLEAMLGLCWAISRLCWALLAAFGPKISTPTEAWFRWGWIWVGCGPFVVHFQGIAMNLFDDLTAI